MFTYIRAEPKVSESLPTPGEAPRVRPFTTYYETALLHREAAPLRDHLLGFLAPARERRGREAPLDLPIVQAGAEPLTAIGGVALHRVREIAAAPRRVAALPWH